MDVAESRGRILVADEEPSARDLVRRRLEIDHYDVILAEDGFEALRKIKEDQPDLVVLDMMMPRLDGIAVIKRVRQDPAIASIPILMLTARDRTTDMVFGLEAGADDYLGKPFEWAELLARVQSLLRRSRHQWADSSATVKRAGVVAFLGAKGGTGTTTIAANTAVALAQDRAGATIQTLERWGIRPKKIGLIANQTNAVMRSGTAEIAQATGRDVLSAIPAAPQACYEATKRGEALIDLAPDLPTSRAILALANAIGAKPDWFPTHIPQIRTTAVVVAGGAR